MMTAMTQVPVPTTYGYLSPRLMKIAMKTGTHTQVPDPMTKTRCRRLPPDLSCRPHLIYVCAQRTGLDDHDY